jgi:hypothetical protein
VTHLEHGVAHPFHDVADGPATVERDQQRPLRAIEHELLDDQCVEQTRAAIKRGDDADDLAPLLQQALDLHERVAQLDRLRAAPGRGLVGCEPERSALAPRHAEAHFDQSFEQLGSVIGRPTPFGGLYRAAMTVLDVQDARERTGFEQERAGLARAREQPEHFGKRQSLEGSLEHAVPFRRALG